MARESAANPCDGRVRSAYVTSAANSAVVPARKIFLNANHSDAHAGQLAESMGSNPRVKVFGQTMVRDHSGLNKVTIELATKLNVTPQDNPTAQGFKSNEAKNVNRLQQLKGPRSTRRTSITKSRVTRDSSLCSIRRSFLALRTKH